MAEKAKEKETKAVTPWKPFMDLSRWEREMDRMMDDFFTRRMRPWWPERWPVSPDSEIVTPVVDVYEEKDDIVLKAELPGMDKNDIEVAISDSELTLKGEKRKKKKSRKRATIDASVPMALSRGPCNYRRMCKRTKSRRPLRTVSWK